MIIIVNYVQSKFLNTRAIALVELRGDEYIFGRAYDNEIVVKKGMIEDRFWNTISKRHFKITKELVQDSSGETTTIACLWDLSQNGTFVNSQQKPVGIGNKVILATNDTISVAKPSFIGTFSITHSRLDSIYQRNFPHSPQSTPT